MLSLYRKHRAHAHQFGRYLLGGGSAAAMEILSYKLMLIVGVYYLVASPISNGIGILTTFLMQKYFVFKKREGMARHAARFTLLTTWNLIAQTFLVYAFVELAGLGPTVAKILGIGVVVSWNFFLYKFFVYT